MHGPNPPPKKSTGGEGTKGTLDPVKCTDPGILFLGAPRTKLFFVLISPTKTRHARPSKGEVNKRSKLGGSSLTKPKRGEEDLLRFKKKKANPLEPVPGPNEGRQNGGRRRRNKSP